MTLILSLVSVHPQKEVRQSDLHVVPTVDDWEELEISHRVWKQRPSRRLCDPEAEDHTAARPEVFEDCSLTLGKPTWDNDTQAA